jgi:glutamate--cysteine ligase
MQSTAGIHFNFSFSESAISSIGCEKTDLYLGTCRNFLRIFPMILRLMGCSPIAHKSFLKGRSINIEKLNEEDCYLPKSTSMRVSRLGYYSEEQDENFITFNTLEDYLGTIKNYINTPNSKFKDISLDLKQQVNNGTIQMESELYNHIRPKGIISKNIRAYSQLKESGIEYLEIRSIDLNPYSDTGITVEDIQFLELVSLYCALSDSPLIDDIESSHIKENIRRSSESGQNCNFICSFNGKKGEESAKKLTADFLDKLRVFAEQIEATGNKEKMFKEFFNRNEVTLSTRFINDVKRVGAAIPLILEKSKISEKSVSSDNLSLFKKEQELSEKQYLSEKNEDKLLFEEYLENFRRELR